MYVVLYKQKDIGRWRALSGIFDDLASATLEVNFMEKDEKTEVEIVPLLAGLDQGGEHFPISQKEWDSFSDEAKLQQYRAQQRTIRKLLSQLSNPIDEEAEMDEATERRQRSEIAGEMEDLASE